MQKMKLPLLVSALVLMAAVVHSAAVRAQEPGTWTFAVSGDSRNCGDFVMPAIAAKVKAEHDAFYWHQGDFRWISHVDQDLLAMNPGTKLGVEEYRKIAWDDFLKHQMTSFGSMPVFLGRGNHETIPPMTRDGYIEKFSAFLNRPEIVAQRNADGEYAAPAGPWYHWTEHGVDFITMDNSSKDEFTDEQLHWLRQVLDHDLKPGSGITTIIAGMHEALPHSTGSEHAMDDWDRGEQNRRTGLHLDVRRAGGGQTRLPHRQPFALLFAGHLRHRVLEAALKKRGARPDHRHRRRAPLRAPQGREEGREDHDLRLCPGQRSHADGVIDFALHELTEQDLMNAKWPNAPDDAIHDCFIHNGDEK